MGAVVDYKGRLAAATEYARGQLLDGVAFELVFHRRHKTGEKLTTRQIISDAEFDKLWGTDFSSHMSEKELDQIDLRGCLGDVDAKCAVIDEAIKYLHAPGLKLSSNRIEVIIQAIAVDALQHYKRLISTKRGQRANKNSARDRYIASTVEKLRSFGFKPTRNREEKRRDSGCSVVAKVLASGGLHLSEQAVEKIWQKSGWRSEP